MIRQIVFALALLCLPGAAHARPVVWGGTPCTPDGTDTDGCYNGGAIQVPNFFEGYANQSVGVRYPVQTVFGQATNAATSYQPPVYPARPTWNVAGVDYAVGMPRWQMPTLSNLHPAYLKDPAQIATDTLVNPKGIGENCKFYASNAAVPGGVQAGGSSPAFPAPFGGPSIYCTNGANSVAPLIFDGYNFGWNSATGYGCVFVQIAGNSFGTSAANTSPDTASVIIRNSLLVNGPNCNIEGGIYSGPGTSGNGPNSPNLTSQIYFAATIPTGANGFAFYNNTVYGCGGDANQSALESALCATTFNSTTYNLTGSQTIVGFVSGATPGVAPVDNHVIGYGGTGNLWIEQNAFIHIPGRVAVEGANNVAGHKDTITRNYVEGMVYMKATFAQISSWVNSGGTQETITTATPHGIAVGGWASIIVSGGGGLPAGWSATWSAKATDATHFVLNSNTNFGDWTYSGTGAHPSELYDGEHAEVIEYGYKTTGATFTGTISGNTLTVSGLTGTLAAGQYITANSAVDASVTGSISGTALAVTAVMSGALNVGQYVTGAGIPVGTYIVAGNGGTWTVNQPITVASETISASDTIPFGTYIVSGSGSTWTLSQNVGNIGPTAMNSPYYTLGAPAGGLDTVTFSYNTVLQTASVSGLASASNNYVSCGSPNSGVPLCVFTGSIDHNVFVANLVPDTYHRSVGTAANLLDYSTYQNLSITNNWIDPTGAFFCSRSEDNDPSTNVTISGNHNLLSPSDPNINLLDNYAIVSFIPGNASNTQKEQGIVYNPSTGVVTVSMAMMPPWLAVGQYVIITNSGVSQGPDYVTGLRRITSVAGNSFTYQTGTGYPGIPDKISPLLSLSNAAGNLFGCYGVN